MKNLLILFIALLCLTTACDKSTAGDDPMAPDMTFDITEFDWRIIEVKNGDFNAMAAAFYILELNSDGTFNLRLDVNNCGGEYTINLITRSIDFKMTACTEACCDSEIALKAVEVLEKIQIYDVAGSPNEPPLSFLQGDDYIYWDAN